MRAQTQWRTFLRESPAYPTEGFAGRGIVILAGGLTYMVPAWVNIHMLRRTGQLLICSSCSLDAHSQLCMLLLARSDSSAALRLQAPA